MKKIQENSKKHKTGLVAVHPQLKTLKFIPLNF